jgi:predicted SprT family Zn-dependent metalloprotease
MQANRITEVYAEGQAALEKFGLVQQGWRFELDNAKRRVGLCSHKTKTISVSIHYIFKSTSEEITDTILHEVAHALVGSKHGHDWTWKSKAVEIGAKPERLAGEGVESTASPNFIIECSGCGQRWHRYRLKRRAYVGAKSVCCHAELKFYKVRKK